MLKTEPLWPMIVILAFVILVMMLRYGITGDVNAPLLAFVGTAFGSLVTAIAARWIARKRTEKEEANTDEKP